MASSLRHRSALERPTGQTTSVRIARRRPEILMLISHFPPVVGGTEIQAFWLGGELVRLGYPVTVLTQRQPHMATSETVADMRVLRVLVGRGRGIVYALTYLTSLLRQIAHQRKEGGIIHAHHLYLEAMAAALSRRGGKLPSLAKVACSGPYGDFARLRRTGGVLVLPLLRQLDRVVAVSQEVRDELSAHGFDAGKIVEIPNGVDATRFSPVPDPERARREVGLGHQTVLFLGRLDPQKGLDVALHAWAQVIARWPGARLVLAGDGPARVTLEAQARALGLGDSVCFLGTRPDPERLLRASTIFLLPSRSEGMSNALLEAMATGLPCVATRIGGNSDLVEHAVTGLLVPPGNAAGLADALCALLEDSTLRLRLGTAARTAVLDRFGMDRVIRAYSDLYATLAGGEV